MPDEILCEHEFLDVRHKGNVYCSTCYTVWSVKYDTTKCNHLLIMFKDLDIICKFCIYRAGCIGTGGIVMRSFTLAYSHQPLWNNALEKLITPDNHKAIRKRVGFTFSKGVFF